MTDYGNEGDPGRAREQERRANSLTAVPVGTQVQWGLSYLLKEGSPEERERAENQLRRARDRWLEEPGYMPVGMASITQVGSTLTIRQTARTTKEMQ